MTTPRDTFFSRDPVKPGELVYLDDEPLGYALGDSEPMVTEDGPGYFVDVELSGVSAPPANYNCRCAMLPAEQPKELTVRGALLLLVGALVVAVPWWCGIIYLYNWATGAV